LMIALLNELEDYKSMHNYHIIHNVTSRCFYIEHCKTLKRKLNQVH
jgi:hypothetical protein